VVNISGTTFTINQAADTRPQNQRFVSLLYTNFLARVPDANGFNFYVNGLNNGTLARDQIAAGFFNSAEFNIIERFTAGLYVGILGRDAEFGGWDYQRRNLLSGAFSQIQLLDAFLTSTEYGLKYGFPDNPTFVTEMFNNALNRQPSPAEVNTFVQQLQSGITRDQVAQTILNSPEFQTGALSRLNTFIMYFITLSRNPDQAGANNLINAFNQGLSIQTALGNLISSPEFLALLGP
jgi:hypothetical protein